MLVATVTLVTTERNDKLLEEAISTLSLEPEVTAVDWQVCNAELCPTSRTSRPDSIGNDLNSSALQRLESADPETRTFASGARRA
ncbi:hypothetical protein [Rhodococcus sp. LB1]|uniref:hypothetical protein n=1 Tax=Rhodococcus sp. LB1 TaxID=1807499 RepID=UPI00077B2377|nr:hypothetical protein [Rhodococcus sp. LB1]KXX59055.1 hypothetical protein AZG88_42885 [Rhodococcus sp. LB1]